MSLEALRAGVQLGLRDLSRVPRRASSAAAWCPNVASFVGHSSVRTYVLGDDATQARRPPTPRSPRCGASCWRRVRAGAIGFATSTLEQHNGENGIPMPSRLADEREMLALTGALGEAGRGVFMLTKGMTSTDPVAREDRRGAAAGR